MNLGNQLVKIRKDNKMSQEDFAEIFNVTRQTISSWENSKSYPDIETLIKISDQFHISLDILLKGDKNMIKKITNVQKDNTKLKKLTLILGIIISLIGIATIIYFGMYYYAKNKLETQFKNAITENNFYKNEMGSYTLNYNDFISYQVPNQKLPIQSGYKFHFFVQQLFCEIKLENNQILNITWIDYNYYGVELKDLKTNNIIKDIGLLGNKETNPISIITKKVKIDNDLLKEALNKGNQLYKDFYE